MRKPRSFPSCGLPVVGQGWPVIWRRAWSDPRLPSQSTCKFENELACITVSLYHTRSMTESCSCSIPLRVISPGVLARVSRLVATQSSMWFAQVEHGMVGGDHDGECVLKSLTTRVGVAASMSSVRSACRLDLSLTSQ